MLNIETIPVTDFPQNARILWCSETREAVILDPGGDHTKLLRALDSLGLKCSQIWLTHSHLDHCGGVAPLMEALPVRLFAHPAEKEFRESVVTVAAMYGLLPTDWHNCPEPTDPIVGGETLSVGNCRAEVLFTPGHSPGHVSFHFEKDRVIASGDVLFQGSIGRTDLPGGNHRQLLESIKRSLFTLDESTRVLVGHGEDTTVGHEKSTNPFFT